MAEPTVATEPCPLQTERNNAKSSLKVDTSSNLYSYINQSNFTSEIFKLEVKGLPKHVGFSEMKNYFKQQGLNHHKVKLIKARSSGFHTQCFITFLSQMDKEVALERIPKMAFKGRDLCVYEANPHKDPHERRKEEEKLGEKSTEKAENDDSGPKSKKPKKAPLSPTDRLAAYHKFPYQEQLSKKAKYVDNILVDINKQMVKNLPRHVRDKEYIALKKIDPETNERVKYTFKCYDIVPAEDEGSKGYRNKCEFTVGTSEEESGDQKLVVGFRGSNYIEKPNLVLDLNGQFKQDMIKYLVPSEMVTCANIFKDLINKMSYKSFNEKDFSGFWRTITVRFSDKTNDMMLCIETQDSVIEKQILKCQERIDQIENRSSHTGDSQETKNFQIKIQKLKSQLIKLKSEEIDLIREHMSAVPKLRSCILDSHTVIFGDKIWREKIFDYVFEISPESFFQVNRRQCEVLYEKIGEEILKKMKDGDSSSEKEKILLDICCGTGTIGISLSQHFKKVLGLEIIDEAVQNANKNAKINNIQNIEFISGPAENTLPEVIAPYHDTTKFSVSAILDPPRNGLHHSLISNVRTCTPIKRLVYISCNIGAKRAIENFCDLTREGSKRMRGERFSLKSVTPVDMFPNTDHVESILVFER